MKRKIDVLGRLVIAKEIRKELKLNPGDYVNFELDGDRIIITKLEGIDKETPIEAILNCEDWECPICGQYVFLSEDEDSYAKPNYCSNCGQALDWSEK